MRSVHRPDSSTSDAAPSSALMPALSAPACAGADPGARERTLFASVMMLGALFSLMTSPCARQSALVSAFVVIGVPALTFHVAAPGRLAIWRELALLARGLETLLLSTLLFALGRRRDVAGVVERQRQRVETAYTADGGRLAQVVGQDPLRLHHARRLAAFGTGLTLLSALALPYLQPEQFTYGDGLVALMTFALDVVVVGLAARLVTERMTVRLMEATHALGGGNLAAARLRVVPLATMLGAAMGAVGGLVVLSAAAAASAIETAWVVDVSLMSSAFWFIRETAPLALPLGTAIGAILGAGAGLAQSDTQPEA